MDQVSEKCYRNPGNPAVLSAVPATAMRILDVGCGAGDDAARCSLPGRVIDGITLSDTEAAAARHVCRDVFVADLEGGLPAAVLARRYDFCICSHVLEHLRWPGRLLRQLHDVLPERGPRLVVALPNIMYFKTRAALVMGRFEYREAGIMDASHFRWYRFRSGRRLLEEAGFPVLRSWAEGSFPLSVLRRVAPATVVGAIDRGAAALVPGLFGSQLLYVA